MAKIAIIGSQGVIGNALLPKLLANGHSLHLLNRSLADTSLANCRHFKADILDGPSLFAGLEGCEAVINLATAIPKSGGSWLQNDKIRREGSLNLIAACQQLGIGRYIQQSIAMLYRTTEESWADETTPFTPNSITQSASDMETLIGQSQLDWLILRAGLLYGKATGREQHLSLQAQKGELFLPKNSYEFISLIHLEDLATAFSLAVNSALTQVGINIVDDRPVSYAEFYHWLAKEQGIAHLPTQEKEAIFAFRVKNNLAKQQLGWQPIFKSFHSGVNH